MSDAEGGQAPGEEEEGEEEEEEEEEEGEGEEEEGEEEGEEAGAGDGGAEPAGPGGRKKKARGRPRLTESDRVRRRLESRKKYDVRRVYLGESHGPWVDLRQRSGWSDAKLAAYLLELEREQRVARRRRRRGKPWEQMSYEPQRKKRRRRNINCLKNTVIWYEDHKNRCPYEPHLSELDPTFGMYTTAVWQCEAGHRYFQDLHSPLKPLSDSENECENVANGTGAGSFGSPEESSSSEAEEQPENQKTKRLARQPSVNAEGESASGLITQDGIHIPFEHHIENLTAEQGASTGHNPPLGGPEAMETVVCVPVPVQMSSGHGALFENVTQETIGEVVASCPVQGVVQGSQVIIIAGPGYDALAAEGIQLNVTSSEGEELPCAVIEGVAAYSQAEPENGRSNNVETTDSMEYTETKKENEELFELKKEEAQSTAERESPCEPEPAQESGGLEAEPEPEEEETEGNEVSSIIYEIPKEPEKRRRSKRSRVTDADGMLEMFHCPYEGCTQVYVALSSFQNHVNLVHRKGKTKVCPHPGCGKKFYLSNHLRRHMIIHSGIREFTCETCGKSFKRKNHLEVHRRTHTGETPLQCEICGYQCRQRASLNWHMKKHTSEVQYNFTCEHCGKRFEKLDSVKFHKLKSHPDHKAA